MPLILTELSFTDIDSFIRNLDSFIRIKALRATNILANSKEFIDLIAEASINYIINNQTNYTKLSDAYQKRKGNFDIFFGTKEIMIKDISSGKAFQISYDDGDILVEIINKIAIYHTLGSGNLPVRSILEITDKFRNEIFDLAVLVLIEEFNKRNNKTMARNNSEKVLALGYSLKKENPEAFNEIKTELNQLKGFVEKVNEAQTILNAGGNSKTLEQELKQQIANFKDLAKAKAQSITETIKAVEKEQAIKEREANKADQIFEREQQREKKREENIKKRVDQEKNAAKEQEILLNNLLSIKTRLEQQLSALEETGIRQRSRNQIAAILNTKKAIEENEKATLLIKQNGTQAEIQDSLKKGKIFDDLANKQIQAIKKVDEEKQKTLLNEQERNNKILKDQQEKINKFNNTSVNNDRGFLLSSIDKAINQFDAFVESLAQGKIPIGKVQSLINNLGSSFGLYGQIVASTINTTISVGSALFELAKNAGEAQRKFDLLGRVTGLSATNIAATEVAAKQIGASFIQVISAIDLLAERTEAAINGSKKYGETFRKLGLDQKQLNEISKDTNKLFLEVVNRFKELPPGIEKATVGYELFGVRAQKVIDQLANLDIKEFTKKIEESGLVADKLGQENLRNLNKALLDFEISFTGLLNIIGTKASPTFTDLAVSIEKAFNQLKDDPKVVNGLKAVLDFTLQIVKSLGSDAIEGISNFVKVLSGIGNALDTLVNGRQAIEELIEGLSNGEIPASKLLSVLSKLGDKVLSIIPGFDLLKSIFVSIKTQSIEPLIDGLKNAGESLKDLLNPINFFKNPFGVIGNAISEIGNEFAKIREGKDFGFDDIGSSIDHLAEASQNAEAFLKGLEDQLKKSLAANKSRIDELELNAEKEIDLLKSRETNELLTAKKILEINQDLSNQKIKLNKENLDLLQKALDDNIITEEKFAEEKLKIEKDNFNEVKRITKETTDLIKLEIEERKREIRKAKDFEIEQFQNLINKTIDSENDKTITKKASLETRKKLTQDILNVEIEAIQQELEIEKLSAKDREKLEIDLNNAKKKLKKSELDFDKDIEREKTKNQEKEIKDREKLESEQAKVIDAGINQLKSKQKNLLDDFIKELKKNGADEKTIKTSLANISFIQQEIDLLKEKAISLQKIVDLSGGQTGQDDLIKNKTRINDLESEQAKLSKEVLENTGDLGLEQAGINKLLREGKEFYDKSSEAINGINAAIQEQQNLLQKIFDLSQFDPFKAAKEGLQDYFNNIGELENIINGLQDLANNGKIDFIGLNTLDFAKQRLAELVNDVNKEDIRQFIEKERKKRRILVDEFKKAQDEIKSIKKRFDDEELEVFRKSRKAIRDIRKQDRDDTATETQERLDLIKNGNDRINEEIKRQQDQALETQIKNNEDKLQAERDYQSSILKIQQKALDDEFDRNQDEFRKTLEFRKERNKLLEERDKAKKSGDNEGFANAEKALKDLDSREKASNEFRDKLKTIEMEKSKKREEIIAESQKKIKEAKSKEEIDLITKQTNEKLALLDEEFSKKIEQEKFFDEFKDELTKEEIAREKKKLQDELDAKAKNLANQQALENASAQARENAANREKEKQKQADAQRLQDIIDNNNKELSEFDRRAEERKKKVDAEIADEQKKREKSIIDIKNREIEAIDELKNKYGALFTGIDTALVKNANSFKALEDLLKNIELLATANTNLFGKFGNAFAEAILAALNNKSSTTNSNVSSFNITANNNNGSTDNNNKKVNTDFNITNNNTDTTPTIKPFNIDKTKIDDDREVTNTSGVGNGNKNNITNKFGKPVITNSARNFKDKNGKNFKTVNQNNSNNKDDDKTVDDPIIEDTFNNNNNTSNDNNNNGSSKDNSISISNKFEFSIKIDKIIVENNNGKSIENIANSLVNEFERTVINNGVGRKLIHFVEDNIDTKIIKKVKQIDRQDNTENFNNPSFPVVNKPLVKK